MKNKKNSKKILNPADFEKMFGEKLNSYVKNKIRKYNFVFREIAPEQRDGYIKKIVSALLSDYIVYAGKHRLKHWEKGWGQNFDELNDKTEIKSITPHYFGKYDVVRINQRLVRPLKKNFEQNSLSVIQDWLFDKYLRKSENIYEFGCGTGHNLFRARAVNRRANIWGLDWATSSQKIIRKLAREGFDKKLFAKKFDFFNPDKNFKLGKNSAVYTIAALEQTGLNYKKFIDYLLINKPEICIHVEPIAELLDENNLLDYLSIKYFQKRKYLSGFLDYLKELRGRKKIKIIKAQRSFIGSLFIDGYSIIVWQPIYE